MLRRYYYWPVTGLSILVVVILWLGFSGLHGTRESNFLSASFFILFIWYLVYFNYPTIHGSFKGLFRSLKIAIAKGKPTEDLQYKRHVDQTKLVEKYLGDRNSAAQIYEFLGPIRFISDHYVYRILTLVYAAGRYWYYYFASLLILLLYIFMPPSIEVTGDLLHDLLNASIFVSAQIAYTSIPRFVSTKWKDYPHYLAKAYFALIESEDEYEIRARHVIDGLEAYNLFLQRNLKIKIKDLQSLYSLLSSDSITIQCDIIGNLCLAFPHSKEGPDKLEPFRGIRNIMKVYYQKELLTGTTKKKSLQELLPLSWQKIWSLQLPLKPTFQTKRG